MYKILCSYLVCLIGLPLTHNMCMCEWKGAKERERKKEKGGGGLTSSRIKKVKLTELLTCGRRQNTLNGFMKMQQEEMLQFDTLCSGRKRQKGLWMHWHWHRREMCSCASINMYCTCCKSTVLYLCHNSEHAMGNFKRRKIF